VEPKTSIQYVLRYEKQIMISLALFIIAITNISLSTHLNMILDMRNNTISLRHAAPAKIY